MHWSLDFVPVGQIDSDTIVDTRSVLVGDSAQPALYRDQVAWKSLKADLFEKKMGFQLIPMEWHDPEMKGASTALANWETLKGQVDGSVRAAELYSIGFKPR